MLVREHGGASADGWAEISVVVSVGRVDLIQNRLHVHVRFALTLVGMIDTHSDSDAVLSNAFLYPPDLPHPDTRFF